MNEINGNTAVLSLPEGFDPKLESQEKSTGLEKDGQRLGSDPPSSANETAFQVTFEQDDPANPKCWSPWYKLWLLLQMAALAFVGSLGSSITAPAESAIAAYLDVSEETTVLTLSLFVLGYAFGPMIWAPISEVYGRKVSMLPAVFVMAMFSVGSAASESPASLFITRFLAGVFGSAPISNVSAALSDMYDARTRGVPMALLALCVVGGPCIAPVVGAAIVANEHLGWRWTMYMLAIISVFVVVVTAFGLPETYPPVCLKRKAQRLRKTTGDERYWHPHESEKISPRNVVTKYLSRPLRMLFTEPMVTCMALYASFVYGLLFFTLEAFPVVFTQERKWNLVVSTLPFLAIFVGVLFALFVNIGYQPWYIKAVERNKGRAVPEARLPPVVIGGVLFTTALFWFGWTATPSQSWVLSVVAAGLIGAGFNITFQQCLNFLVDTYGPYAASATAANTFLRSLLASGLPLAARPMFRSLGVGPACSLLGGFSCLALPVPFLFIKYGSRLRRRSKFVPVAED